MNNPNRKVSSPIRLDVNYWPDDRLWTFDNPSVLLPAGAAVLDVGPVGISVSLAEPDLLVSITVDTSDPFDMSSVHHLLELAVGRDAAELVRTHDRATPLREQSVWWIPGVGERWSTVGRLALLAQLEAYADDGSPWWVLEQVGLIETLADDLFRPISTEAVQLAAERLLARPLSSLNRLATRALAINGQIPMGPAEILEAAARSLKGRLPDLAERLETVADQLAPGAELVPIEPAYLHLVDLKPDDRPMAFLGGGPKGRKSLSAYELVEGSVSVDHDDRNLAVVRCSVKGESVFQALQGLWARATESRSGAVVAIGAFSEKGLLSQDLPFKASYVDEQTYELYANLALPSEAKASDLLIEVTTSPTLSPATDKEISRGIALRASIDALQAARLGSTIAESASHQAKAAHLNAGDSNEASWFSLPTSQRPVVPLAELDSGTDPLPEK